MIYEWRRVNEVRESQLVYLHRRSRVSEVCKELVKHISRGHRGRSKLLYNGEHCLVYCPTPKVSSSFWTLNMDKLDPELSVHDWVPEGARDSAPKDGLPYPDCSKQSQFRAILVPSQFFDATCIVQLLRVGSENVRPFGREYLQGLGLS